MIKKDQPKDWQLYQTESANLFLELGCEVIVDHKINGARGVHRIDVWVNFKRFGLNTNWIIECKYWNTSIPKEKVMALKSIVDDIGVERGILISKKGFQSGALKSAIKTNIILTSLDDLRISAKDDLNNSLLETCKVKIIQLKRQFNKLTPVIKRNSHSITAAPLPGIEFRVVLENLGKLSFLESGFEQVYLNEFPIPIWPFNSIEQSTNVNSIDEFLNYTSLILDQIQGDLNEQMKRLKT